MLLILLGLLSGQWVGHHLVSVCVWKSETCPFVWDVQHDFCLSCRGHLEKLCILFVFFHVLLHYVTVTPCSIIHYYMVLICVQVMYTCAIVMKIHILPFCCFCIQHTQCICCIFGVVMTQCISCIFFSLFMILLCVETLDICSCVILCKVWSSHLPCRLWYVLFQILKVCVKCYTFFIEFLCILMYDILLAYVWVMVTFVCW